MLRAVAHGTLRRCLTQVARELTARDVRQLRDGSRPAAGGRVRGADHALAVR